MLVQVEGDPKAGEYTDEDGVDRDTFEVVAQSILKIDFNEPNIAEREPGDDEIPY
jgi:single-stranded DNA-binding protein